MRRGGGGGGAAARSGEGNEFDFSARGANSGGEGADWDAGQDGGPGLSGRRGMSLAERNSKTMKTDRI